MFHLTHMLDDGVIAMIMSENGTWLSCHGNTWSLKMFVTMVTSDNHALVAKVTLDNMYQGNMVDNVACVTVFNVQITVERTVGRVGKVGQEGGTKAIQKLLHKVVRMFRVWWNVLLESFRFFLHALLYLENFSRFTVILNNNKNKNHLVHPSIEASCGTFTKVASNKTVL